jgi:hypothetical protein
LALGFRFEGFQMPLEVIACFVRIKAVTHLARPWRGNSVCAGVAVFQKEFVQQLAFAIHGHLHNGFSPVPSIRSSLCPSRSPPARLLAAGAAASRQQALRIKANVFMKNSSSNYRLTALTNPLNFSREKSNS